MDWTYLAHSRYRWQVVCTIMKYQVPLKAVNDHLSNYQLGYEECFIHLEFY
jgi:hypothetical protein